MARMIKVTLANMIACLVSPSCGANGSNVELSNVSITHSLNTNIGVSECLPESVEKNDI